MDPPGRRIDRLERVVQAAKAYSQNGIVDIHNEDVIWREV